jgi:hypothetical protein
MSLDSMEAIANAVAGLVVSMVAVWALRASGAWLTAPAWVIAALFFLLSLARSRALRWAFRRAERPEVRF